MPKGFVYFIQSVIGGPIKIGYSEDPPGRLWDLQTANFAELRILAAVSAEPADERKIQNMFDEERVGREWFAPSSRLVGHVASLGGEVFPLRLWNAATDRIPDRPQTPRRVSKSDVGARVRELRRRLDNMTQDELAERSGLNRVEISNIETGRNLCRSVRIQQCLARGFGLENTTASLYLAGQLPIDAAALASRNHSHVA